MDTAHDVAAVAAADQRPQRVYECVLQGVRTFSDLPCGPDAGLREVKMTISIIDAMPVAATPPAASKPRAAAPAKERPLPRPDAQCPKLFTDKRNLDARMREGYRGEEGERLRAEHHRLTTELYRLRCKAL